MKKAFAILIVVLTAFITFKTSAKSIDTDDILKEQMDLSGVDKLYDALPEDISNALKDFEIENIIKDDDAISFGRLIENFSELFKPQFNDVIACGFSVLALLLAAATFNSFGDENKVLKYAVTVGVTTAAVVPAAKLITSVVSAVKAFSTFMVSFVPIYAGVLASSGKALTAAGYSSIMLLAVEGINLICAFVLIPLSGMQLSLGICSPLGEGIDISGVAAAIKKFSMWTLSGLTTLLLGFLSVQTIITGSKDNLISKTAKFVAGTAIPLVGPTVSEAMNIIKGCLKLLSSSVLIYAVIAVALILLPILLKLVIWRVAMNLCSFSASMLSLDKPSKLLKSIDSVFAFLIGILTLSMLLFLISLTIVSL